MKPPIISKIWLLSPTRSWHLLPVTPETISFEDNNKIMTTELLSVGETSQLGANQLKKITFSSFFPEFMDDYVHTKGRDFSNEEITQTEIVRYIEPPQDWVARIKRLMKERVYIAITYPRVLGYYYINDFQHSLVGGEGGDITYMLNLIEARSSSTRSIDMGQMAKDMLPQLTFVPYTRGDSTYIVKGGETLTQIARKTGHGTWALKYYNNIVDSSFAIREGARIFLTNTRPSSTRSPFADPFVSRFP